MEIQLKASSYNQKVNLKEVVKNFFDFSPGSALTEIFSIESSKEMKAFLLLYSTAKNTNVELFKQLDQDIVNKSFDVVVASDIEHEVREFLEEDVKLTKDFFEDTLNHDLTHMIKSYLIFRNYGEKIGISMPSNFEYIYYLAFRKNLLVEYNKNKESYQELLAYLDNKVSDENLKFSKLIGYYESIKRLYTDRLQKDIPEAQETLNDLYIDPQFSFLSNNTTYGTDNFRFIDTRDEKITVHNFLNNYFLRREHYIDCIENYNMLFILGQPGQGKTSLCYRVIYDYLEQNHGLPSRPIFFLKIRDLTAKDFIAKPFEEINKFIKQNFNFNSEEGILVLDGLDEAYMGGGISDNDLRLLYERLRNTANNNKGLSIILTSRLNYLKLDEPCLDNTLIIELKPLSDIQITEYAKKFQKFYPKNKFIKKIKLLLKDKDYKHIKELLKQAVLIYFIAIADIDIEEKDSRAVIYDKIFKTLALRLWDKRGQLDYIRPKVKKSQELYEKHLRDYIRSVAFSIYQSPNLYITLNNLISLKATTTFVKKCFNDDIADSPDKLKEISKYLLISFYFQESNNNQNVDTAIEFFHNSLWEYLTAEYMWIENKKALMREDDDGDYERPSKEQYFDLINNLIGQKRLQHSVYNNLVEIIQGEADEVKKVITSQSKDLFFKLLEDDFLLEYRRKDSLLTPFEKIVNIFELCWTFYYFSNLSCGEYIETNTELERYLFKHSYMFMAQYDFENIIFTDGPAEMTLCDNNTFVNALFFGEILNCTFYASHFYNSKFESYFNDCIFTRNKFENVVFHDCAFSTIIMAEGNVFKNCSFINVEVPSLAWLEEFYDKNLIDEKLQAKEVLEPDYSGKLEKKYYIGYNK